MDNRPLKKVKAKKRLVKKGVQAFHYTGTIVHYGTSKNFITQYNKSKMFVK